MEEAIDDALKEKHFTTEAGRRLKLCEDCEEALTSELAATRMKTGNQFVRVDDVGTKGLREQSHQGYVGIPVFWLPHLPRAALCLQLHGRWHPHRWRTGQGKVAYFATHVCANIAMALSIQVSGVPKTGSP